MMVKLSSSICSVSLAAALLGGCAAPSPYRAPTQPPEQEPPSEVETRPGEPPTTVAEPEPLPPPAVREPSLSAASRALVSQAEIQMASRNYAVAAGSIERALRIEPGNPLLWIELGKIRLAEGNYVQAENMGRRAVSMSVSAPRAQSAAWRLIAESYRARGNNIEAQQAEARAQSLVPR